VSRFLWIILTMGDSRNFGRKVHSTFVDTYSEVIIDAFLCHQSQEPLEIDHISIPVSKRHPKLNQN